jgi:hypothetical protein
MPAKYSIDAQRGIVFSTATGVLTDDDCGRHIDALHDDPKFSAAMDQLADFTQVTEVRLTADAIHTFARRNAFGEGARRAFVVADDTVYGMARMYQTLTSHQPHDLIVFRSMPEARAWLCLSP